MIRPWPCSIIAGSAARVTYMTPNRFTRMKASQTAGSSSAKGFMSSKPMVVAFPALPALFTTMPSVPSAVTAASTAGQSVTSNTAVRPWPPAASISETTDAARSSTRSLTTTSAPASARVRAMRRPTPWPAPVTRARRPMRSMVTGISRGPRRRDG